ncbi:hypothetical protein ACLOJK_012826 [Asimina triloba]
MGGVHPTTIVTDQDAIIEAAIATVARASKSCPSGFFSPSVSSVAKSNSRISSKGFSLGFFCYFERLATISKEVDALPTENAAY